MDVTEPNYIYTECNKCVKLPLTFHPSDSNMPMVSSIYIHCILQRIYIEAHRFKARMFCHALYCIRHLSHSSCDLQKKNIIMALLFTVIFHTLEVAESTPIG